MQFLDPRSWYLRPRSHYGHLFRKAPLSRSLPSTLKRKIGAFKFLRFEVRFRKVPFSGRICVNGRPHRTHKAAFSNFSGLVWKGPNCPFCLVLRSDKYKVQVLLIRTTHKNKRSFFETKRSLIENSRSAYTTAILA